MELKEFIAGIAKQFEDTDSSEIQPETNFQELDEWDSITALNIIAYVKISYGKAITGREIRGCKTLEELYNLVNSK